MIALLPVVIEDPDDIMLSSDGLELVHRLLDECAAASRIDGVVVPTNRPEIRSLVSKVSRPAPSSCTSPSHSPSTSPSPSPARCISVYWEMDSRLRPQLEGPGELFRGRAAELLRRHGEAIVINFRNPLLRAARIDAAVDELGAGGADIVLSVVRPTDHPCQLFSLEPRSDGWSCSSRDARFHAEVPFPPDPRLWTVDPESGRKTNVAADRVILGRQDQPEVFEPDGSLLAVRARAIDGEWRRPQLERIRAHVMPPDESIEVRTMTDLLRCHAIARAHTFEDHGDARWTAQGPSK